MKNQKAKAEDPSKTRRHHAKKSFRPRQHSECEIKATSCASCKDKLDCRDYNSYLAYKKFC